MNRKPIAVDTVVMEGRGPLKSDPAYVKLQEYFEANGDKLNIRSGH